jgi:hypothetical protein
MKNLASLGVWAYLIASNIAQVVIFYMNLPLAIAYLSIGVLAASNAVTIAIFTMELKNEPRSLHYLVLAPIVLVMVLILALGFSIAH